LRAPPLPLLLLLLLLLLPLLPLTLLLVALSVLTVLPGTECTLRRSAGGCLFCCSLQFLLFTLFAACLVRTA